MCESVADAADRQYAYVVVTTKAIPELTKTPQILSPLLAKDYIGKFEQPNYVLMQNGLNVEVDLHNTLTHLQLHGQIREKPSIITSALWIATNLKAPNVVEHDELVRVIQQLIEQNANNSFSRIVCRWASIAIMIIPPQPIPQKKRRHSRTLGQFSKKEAAL